MPNDNGDATPPPQQAGEGAERELARLAAIVESSDDAIVSKDLNGVIQTWNKGAERIFGYRAEEAIGRPVAMLIPDDRADEEPGILERIRRGLKVDHYETVRRRKDGTLIDVSLTVSPIVDASGRVVGASKIAREVTEKKKIESVRRERTIMQRLLSAQEAERNRIARDLHDHLGQRMTALRLHVEAMAERCGGHDAAAEDFSTLREMTSRIDRDIGYLSWELRPTEIDELGLPDAVRSFVSEWTRHYGVEAEFHSIARAAGDDARLPRETETNLYRIVQEALNNIAKHAHARHVTVLLQVRRDFVMLTIEDDGDGFDPSAPRQRGSSRGGGLGLRGMAERAELMKGSLDVESSPGVGTTILVRVPRRRVAYDGISD